MITILLQKILAALIQLLGNIKTKLNTIKDNLDDLIVVATASGPIASFTTTITKPFISFIVDIPETESGTDTVIITLTGANLWDEITEVGNINNTSGEKEPSTSLLRTKNYIKVVAGKTYYFKSSASYNGTLFFYDKDHNFLSLQYKQNDTFTVPANACYMLFKIASGYGTTYNNDYGVNFPATITTYEPYSATTKTVSLPSTVYGGEVDITESILPEIKAKNGVNNIFSDSGDVTVEYLKLYKED